jgi:hypothetical protein
MRNSTKRDQAALASNEGLSMELLVARAPHEAADAVERFTSDPGRHSKVACTFADEYFDPARVLTLLDRGSAEELAAIVENALLEYLVRDQVGGAGDIHLQYLVSCQQLSVSFMILIEDYGWTNYVYDLARGGACAHPSCGITYTLSLPATARSAVDLWYHIAQYQPARETHEAKANVAVREAERLSVKA